MDISAEIAAIQAASQGSELRQPLVGALNKLNSGSLPAVTASDVGKILKVGANGWEVGEKSGYMPVPTATMQITDNDTYDVTNYASAVVNVSGGGGGGTQNPFIVDASSTYSGASLSAQNAFGVNASNYWGSNGATSDWLRMHFLEPISISKVSFTNTYISGNLHWSSQRIVFQYSDDNNVWNDLFDKANLSDSASNLFEETIQNSGEHLYYRFLCYKSSSYYAGIGKVVVNVSNISSTLIPKTITQNGTYDPTDDNADGYSQVTVNVSGGGVATLQYHLGRLAINTGAIEESNEYCYSDLIPISTGSGRWFVDLTRSYTDSYYMGISFYASDGETNSGYIRQYENYRSYSLTGGSNHRYFRIANKVSNLPFANVAFLTDSIFVVPQAANVYRTNFT